MTQPDRPTSAAESATAHSLSDVDAGANSQHHTLGFGPAQSAAGDHTHNGINSAPIDGSYSPVGHGHVEGDVVSLVFDLSQKYSSTNAPPYPVTSVAGKTGAVLLAEADIAGLVADVARITALESRTRYGLGSPETVVTAPVGTLYLRSDGGSNTTLYVKESGILNIGWVAK